MLVGTSTVALAQSASAPLLVTATVVSSCTVNHAHLVDRAGLSTTPVNIACARNGSRRDDFSRVERPPAPHRSVGHALLVINF